MSVTLRFVGRVSCHGQTRLGDECPSKATSSDSPNVLDAGIGCRTTVNWDFDPQLVAEFMTKSLAPLMPVRMCPFSSPFW